MAKKRKNAKPEDPAPSHSPLIVMVRGVPHIDPQASNIVRVRGVDTDGKKYAIKGCKPRLVRKGDAWWLQLDQIPDSRLPYRPEVPIEGISKAISTNWG